MTTVWKIQDLPSSLLTEQTTLPYSELLVKLLAVRGFSEADSIQKYLFPSLEHLYSPFLMKGVREACERILLAIERKEQIFIHGDYDVDGITAAALLCRAFQKLGARFTAFLPNRKRDGYGVSLSAIQAACAQGATILITVDCGVTAFEQMKWAKENGMDAIIIDHHQIHESQLPEACAVINPIQSDCTYPFKELSACGLAFKLAQALIGPQAFEFLDLAALSSVCDVAPLKDENRVIVSQGLETLSKRANPGFKSLCEVSGLRRKKIMASDLAFILGPRINAAGRMSSPDSALHLLTGTDEVQAMELARGLDKENSNRRSEDQMLLKKALQMVEREINFSRDRVIVVGNEGWHEGVIGIVAQRLVEYFARPAVVIAFKDGVGKGSGRSIKGFHLFEGFKYCQDMLEAFGGHELAAGISIRKERLNEFKAKMNEFAFKIPPETFFRSVSVDLEVELKDLSPQFLMELTMLEPFGAGNSRPVFLSRGLQTKKKPVSMKYGAGLQWWVTDGVHTFEAIWKTRGREIEFPDQEPYALVYSPSIRVEEGTERVVLEVRDAKVS